MKRILLVIGLLLMVCGAASAQSRWSRLRVEIGTGYQPLHMGFWGNSPSYAVKEALAEKGQAVSTAGMFRPNIIASVVWRSSERWEWVLTGDICWSHHRLTQYEQFGYDPEGKPRYDLNKPSDAGWADSTPIASATLQWRYHWNPWSIVQFYSGFGLGVSAGTHYIPTPSLTPIGIRVGGHHLYGFVEVPVSPFATLVDGGLGWTF